MLFIYESLIIAELFKNKHVVLCFLLSNLLAIIQYSFNKFFFYSFICQQHLLSA